MGTDLSAGRLIRQIRRAGAIVAVIDGQLMLKGNIPDMLRDSVRRHKEAIVALLSAEHDGRSYCLSAAEIEEYELSSDPARSERPDDSASWAHLLSLVFQEQGPQSDLLHALRTLRMAGARLEPAPQGVRLNPGQELAAEYAEIRDAWLGPHAVLLARLLSAMPRAPQPAVASAALSAGSGPGLATAQPPVTPSMPMQRPPALAALDVDGLWITGEDVQHRRLDPPEPGAVSAAALLDVASRERLEQLWLHPRWCAAAGLPLELRDPETDRPIGGVREGLDHPFITCAAEDGWDMRPAGLAAWLHAFRPGTYGAIDLVFPQYDRRTSSWGETPDGTTLLDALVYYERAAGIRYRHSPEASSSELLRRLHHGTGALALEAPAALPPPALDPRVEWDCSWARAPGEEEGAGCFLHSYDKNGAYLSVCGSLAVGYGELQHVTSAVVFDKVRPGYWLAAIGPPKDVMAGALPDPFHREPRGPRNNPAATEPAWYTTPTVALAVEIGAAVRIEEAYLWSERRRPLEPWYKRLRDARTGLQEDTVCYPDRHAAAAALRAIKLSYGPLLGGRMASDKWDRSGDPLYRPDIRHTVLAQVRANQYRLLRSMAEEGVFPVMVHSDAIYIFSDDPDPVAACPKALRLGDGLGAYKTKDVAVPAEAVAAQLREHAAGASSARMVKRALLAISAAGTRSEGSGTRET